VNVAVLGLQFGMAPARVAGMLLPAVVPFNALNAALAVFLAEPVLRAARPHRPTALTCSGSMWMLTRFAGRSLPGYAYGLPV